MEVSKVQSNCLTHGMLRSHKDREKSRPEEESGNATGLRKEKHNNKKNKQKLYKTF